MNKANDPNYILNPNTGRWVLKTGQIGKKLLKQNNQQHQDNKANDPKYILNPNTGNWVLKTGQIGKKILKQNNQQQQQDSKANDPKYILNPSTGKWVLKTGKIGNSLLEPHESREIILKNLKSISSYSYSSLTKLSRKCGITITGNKKIIYRILLYNKIWECDNEYDLLGNKIIDINPNKVIQINKCCYNIDTLGEYLIKTKFKNVDPYNDSKKLWNTLSERDIIINHPGMDKNIYKNIKILEKQIIKDANVVLLGPDTQEIVSYIGISGWICVNDNTSSYSENPEEFQYAQKVLKNLFNIINDSPNKDNWLLVQTPLGINLNSIIDTMSTNCIHGVGFKLIGLFSYLYKESKILGNKLTLPDIYINESETIEFKGGFQNDITMNSKVTYIRVSNDGRASRSTDEVKGKIKVKYLNIANIIKAELLSLN